MTDALISGAERDRRVEQALPRLRATLCHLEPVEAVAALHTLACEVLDSFPPDDRVTICSNWTDAIRAAVRVSLD